MMELKVACRIAELPFDMKIDISDLKTEDEDKQTQEPN